MGQSVIINGSSGSGSTTFLALLDTFNSFAGNANKFVKVNAGETALEAVASAATTAWGGLTGTLSDQTDLQSALDAKQNTITNSDSITEGATNLFLTSAERTKLSNTSGTNTGDQDISGIATNASNISTLNTNKADKSNVLELDNTDVFTPTADYHPATKKYVDDGAGGGSHQETWQTATTSTTSAGTISLTTNRWVHFTADGDCNLTMIDQTTISTGYLYLLKFTASGATRTITNGLASGAAFDNFGGAIQCTTSEAIVMQLYKDNAGVLDVRASVGTT